MTSAPDPEAGPSHPPRPQPRPLAPPTHPSHPFTSAAHRPERPDGRYRVLVITSGSVASVKLPLIVGELVKDPRVDVQVVATRASLHFYTQEQVDEAAREALRGVSTLEHAEEESESRDEDQGQGQGRVGVKVWTDEDEWSDWRTLGDPILHIELRRWADLIVVAPCSADFLAKLAAGFTDNLALSILRANPIDKPVLLCPAMNTHMYQHPLTAEHLHKVESVLRYAVSGPQGTGVLACGDEGPGKMTDWREVVAQIQQYALQALAEGTA